MRNTGAWRRPYRYALAATSTLATAVTLAIVLLLPTGTALAAPTIVNPTNPFAPFSVPQGQVLTVKGPNCTSAFNGSSGADVCVITNPFLTTNFGMGTDNTLHGNGQSCETCHQPQLGWSITPEFLQDRFDDTRGTADAFRVNDSATDPRVCGKPTSTTESAAAVAADVNACVSSMTNAQKRDAYQLFKKLGVARIAIKLSGAPTDDFTVTAATTSTFGALPIPAGDDSQQPCSVQGATCVPTLSLFRRPLITTNTFFDSSVLWDGRQNVCVALVPPTPTPGAGSCTAATPLRTPLLENQVSGAAQTLLLAAPPTTLTEDMAAHFMTGIFTAQNSDKRAGSLQALGANGGPQFLADMATGTATAVPPCTPLVEAPVANSGGGNPPPACSTGKGFSIFGAWNTLGGGTDPCAKVPDNDNLSGTDPATQQRVRLLIACGEQIFDTRPINDPAVGRDVNNVPNARCTSCHAAQNVGDNSNPLFLLPYTPGGGIGQNPAAFVGGATDASTDPFCATHKKDPFCQSLKFKLPQFQRRTSDLPLYTVTQAAPGTGVLQVTDPGQALITHHFANTGGMKPPQLRNLAARAPYFHNGAAESLDDLVDFYDQNFSIGLTNREHRALVAFLSAI